MDSIPQNTPVPPALNDSGCLLGDTELFDTGLDDEQEEEEESLEAIRAAVKQKMKKNKVLNRSCSFNASTLFLVTFVIYFLMNLSHCFFCIKHNSGKMIC